jgi:hypothetical protein
MLAHLRDDLTVCALAVTMVLAAIIGLRHLVGIAMLALLAFVWLTLDKTWEGGVLVSVSGGHGLTQADLAGVLALVVAALELWRWWVRPRR